MAGGQPLNRAFYRQLADAIAKLFRDGWERGECYGSRRARIDYCDVWLRIVGDLKAVRGLSRESLELIEELEQLLRTVRDERGPIT